jgi:phosphoserine phosphatase
MTTNNNKGTLSLKALEQILDVTRRLAAPFDLPTLLNQIVDAARQILEADRGTVFLYDPKNREFETTVATNMDAIRFPANRGIAGYCAQTLEIVNVPDCYADPRFDQSFDQRTGYYTRCSLTLPLIDYEDDSFVGVLQIINKLDGIFDDEDERVAAALAAQCAVALQRVRLTQKMLLTEKLDREITVAREIQMGTLPSEMPSISGFDVAGIFHPADQTGGDLFDFVPLDDDRLIILMGDATGHGIGPALSATQVRAMNRVALRLDADLDSTFVHINDQLTDDLPDDRFVTAFLGLLEGRENRIHFHSGGQGPLMHFTGADSEIEWMPPTTFPLGFMPQTDLKPASILEMAPGDVLGLISDGVYEYENEIGRQFGQSGVAEIIRRHHHRPMSEVVDIMLRSVRDYGASSPQADDITIVLIRRLPSDIDERESEDKSE